MNNVSYTSKRSKLACLTLSLLLEQRDKECKQNILEVQLLPRITEAYAFSITLATRVPLLE